MPDSDLFEITLDVNRCNRDEISIELKDSCIVVNTRKVF
jgi:hypothetical protein